MKVIEIKNLSKEFKTLKREPSLKGYFKTLFSRNYEIKKALDNIGLEVQQGEFLGVIGPNGAGKSTLIKILTGVLTPTSGEVKALDLVPYKQRISYTKNIGVVFGQRTQLWWDLPVIDSFELLKHIFKIPDKIYKENIENFSKILGIDKYLSVPVRKLSLGERMRCDLAASLLHNPKIVFLDEPTIGLDVEAKYRIREFLKELNKKGVTIIITTHDMSDIEELCSRIVIIDKGKKIFDGKLSEIKRKFKKERVLVIELHEAVDVNEISFSGIKLLEKIGNEYRFEIDTNKITISDVIRKILSKYSVHDILIEEPSIEEIIREIYKKGLNV
ncbi:MAG: ATP-binding cassette domain-containing protein [Candidatus Aenigmatarchaeota archaeon]